jgi:polyhydroxybutyrate depolymerase
VGSADLGTEEITPSDGVPVVEELPPSEPIDLGEYTDDIEPRPSAGCGIVPHAEPGQTEATDTQVGDLDRKYYLHLPSGYDPDTPTSLVLSLHGYTDSAVGMEYGTGMNVQADKYGFIIVYPDATSFSSGSGPISSWNDLSCNASPGPEVPICSENAWTYEFPPECGKRTDCNWCTCHDDLAFIKQMLDELEGNLCIDRNRIYATGMSNGGMFVHRLGCDMANRFAAIAPVSGTLARGFNCAPDTSTQISIMNIHGLQDDYVDVTGKESSDGYLYTAVTDVMAAWSAPQSQGCDLDVTPYQTVADGLRGMACTQNANCLTGAEVVSCWWNAGHDWPAGDVQFGNEMIWEFFRKNPKQK